LSRAAKPASPSAWATSREERRIGRCVLEPPVEDEPESDSGAVSSLDPFRLTFEGIIASGESEGTEEV
jgi:hypothetical protein